MKTPTERTGGGGEACDVIVVGGGHNGLTCAAFLARAGKRVLVLEARSTLGGFATTEETVPEAPGFKMNAGAIDLVLTGIPRSIIDDLELRQHGLRLIDIDPHTCWLGPDGQSIAFWRDLERTRTEIARFSHRDAERYVRLATIICDTLLVAAPYIQGHPTRPTMRGVGELVWRAARSRRSLMPGARILLSSAAQVIEEWFDRDEIKALLACFATSWMSRLEEPGSAAALAAIVAPHRFGCQRAIGGMGALTEALARCVTATGGDIRVGIPVREIVVRNGRAIGVTVDTGEEIRAATVVAALDPTSLVTKLIDPEVLAPDVHAEIRALAVQASNLQLFKADVALRRMPDLSSRGRTGELLASGCYVILAPDLGYVRRAVDANLRGEVDGEVLLWFALPSMTDRTLVPPGGRGETLYVYVPAAPMKPTEGEWADEKEKYLDRCLDIIDSTYVPGLRDHIIGTSIRSPAELATNVHRGSIWHVDITPSQLGPWRPTPALAGYRTPIEGLWHTGSGAHPMGGVSGWSGRTAARTIIRAKQ